MDQHINPCQGEHKYPSLDPFRFVAVFPKSQFFRLRMRDFHRQVTHTHGLSKLAIHRTGMQLTFAAKVALINVVFKF